MAANAWRERWDLAQSYIISTQSTDQSVVLPSHIADAQTGANAQVCWRMFVSGTPANFNIGAAATSANVLLPIGGDDAPKFMAAGTYHALANPTTATGQVFFVPCFFTG